MSAGSKERTVGVKEMRKRLSEVMLTLEAVKGDLQQFHNDQHDEMTAMPEVSWDDNDTSLTALENARWSVEDSLETLVRTDEELGDFEDNPFVED